LHRDRPASHLRHARDYAGPNQIDHYHRPAYECRQLYKQSLRYERKRSSGERPDQHPSELTFALRLGQRFGLRRAPSPLSLQYFDEKSPASGDQSPSTVPATRAPLSEARMLPRVPRFTPAASRVHQNHTFFQIPLTKACYIARPEQPSTGILSEAFTGRSPRLTASKDERYSPPCQILCRSSLQLVRASRGISINRVIADDQQVPLYQLLIQCVGPLALSLQ
jgi:hypothetical protein